MKSSKKQGKEKYEKEYYSYPPKNVCSNKHNSGSVRMITQCEEEYIHSYFFKKKKEEIKMTGEL